MLIVVVYFLLITRDGIRFFSLAVSAHAISFITAEYLTFSSALCKEFLNEHTFSSYWEKRNNKITKFLTSSVRISSKTIFSILGTQSQNAQKNLEQVTRNLNNGTLLF